MPEFLRAESCILFPFFGRFFGLYRLHVALNLHLLPGYGNPISFQARQPGEFKVKLQTLDCP
jgi:hypothetical protein